VSYDGCPSCNAGLEATTGCCFECDDLRAGITRAENDLAEARTVISELRTMFMLDSNIAPHRKAPYCDLIDTRCEGWLS
jgi:hypothetical protein